MNAVLGPTVQNDQCCYELQMSCYVYVGRAFLVDDHLVKAEMQRGAGWLHGPLPDASSLSPATRRALRDAWVKDGLFEHASVATFARFALQLLAVGAPAELLEYTLAAGRDEIRHAELCFALASAYEGEPLEPAGLPVPPTLQVATDLAGIVEETVVEGCIGETLAAMQAAEQLRRTKDPAVIAALEATIEDESRHAELAWRVVAWAIRVGGEPVRRVVEATFSAFEPPAAPVIDLTGVDLAAFEAHGRLSPREARAVALEAIERVVRPAAAALLERDVLPRRRTLAVGVSV